ncbi:unnamed protein product [Acanthoscelides obtectus]|nr:unnamed protein product [Acanthoscelides obtectus]CAK1631237.1 Zinc finger protein 782 [Acanthoscelides obtectus]
MTSAQTSQTQNLYQCRLCLKRTPTRVNIFGGDFPKMLEILTSIKVRENDGLPKYSCLKCAQDVKSALIIKKRIIKAHKYLIENLRKRNISTVSNQRAPVQAAQTSRKPVLRSRKVVIPDKRTEPKTETKSPTAQFSNENTVDQQNSDDVRENDGLPKYSCLKCAQDVKSALIIRQRIIKTHKYFKECVKKGIIPKSAQRTAIQVQPPQKTILNKPTNLTPYKQNEPSKTETTKLSTVSINENSSSSQVLENSEDTMAKVEVKLEPLSEGENSNDAFAATENSDAFVNEIRYEANTTRKHINLKCELCNDSFSDRYAYYLHSLRHQKVKCDICSKVTRKDNFKKHMLLHSDIEPAVCNLCGATFKNPESLRGHTRYIHNNRNVICEECGKKFKTKYYLDLHRNKVHTGTRNFKCDTCGKAFFTKADLWKHDRKTHKKMRPYICEYCKTGFSSQYALKTHRRQHTNEKPFICDHCNEGFRQKVSLRSHLKSKHGIEEAKEFICPECGRGFATKFALNVHQKQHAIIKCSVCSEPFAGQEYLYNHMKEVHGIDNDMEEDESQDTEESQQEQSDLTGG